MEPVDESNPQSLYEQAWAVAVLDQAMSLLEAEYASAGKQVLFEQLASCLQGDRTTSTYAEIGAAYGARTIANHVLSPDSACGDTPGPVTSWIAWRR